MTIQPSESLIVSELISPARFAKFIGIGRRTFQTWRAAGKLPMPDLHLGKVIRWRRETIDRWIATQGHGERRAR